MKFTQITKAQAAGLPPRFIHWTSPTVDAVIVPRWVYNKHVTGETVTRQDVLKLLQAKATTVDGDYYTLPNGACVQGTGVGGWLFWADDTLAPTEQKTKEELFNYLTKEMEGPAVN